MKQIQDCLNPNTGLGYVAELERVKLPRILFDTTYSVVARFGAGVMGWLTARGADNHDAAPQVRRVAGARGTTAVVSAESPPTKRITLRTSQREARKRLDGSACADDECAYQQELSRVQRDLHDQVGSSLAGMTMQLEVAQRLMCSDADRAMQMLSELHSTTSQLFTTVREMSAQQRWTEESRVGDSASQSGSREGCDNMTEALRHMTSRMQRVVRGRLDITLDVGADVASAPSKVSWAAFWIVKEALTNVLRHSHARQCLVALWTDGGELRLRVEDDGIGGINTSFDPSKDGSGLGNMVDRATEHGGWCTLQDGVSTGVVVSATLPLVADENTSIPPPANTGLG